MQRQLNSGDKRPQSFKAFKKALKAVGARYPGQNLVASMAARVSECLEKQGARIRR